MTYDAGGRLLTIAKNIDNASSDQTIITNTYNELGQLSNKQLGNNIENLAYAYNIRGWLTSINKNYLSGSGSNYFGMELGYDKTTAAVGSTSYVTPEYNGNIEGTIWKSKGDGIARKYDFTYDNVNRLSAASFLQNSSGSTWDNSYLNFTANNLSYDANGNIMTMNQYGFKVNGSGPIDQLTYTYQTNSNKLSKVDDAFNDAGSKLGDFHYSGTKGSYDYSYDGNGNLVLDNNKAISSITYNPLNLPNQVSVTNKGTITYTYDAAGDKLKKTTVEGAKTTTTLYLGGTVYQNDTLQFISHEEGRARWALHHYVNGTTAYGFEYDYFLKDHLGNTRMVLTQEKDTAQYIATMEAAYRNTENQLFYNIPLTSYARNAVSGYPTDNTTVPNDSLARVNGNGPKTGPSLLLKVMSGDVVDIATKSFYKSGGTVNSPNSILTDVINSLAGGIVTATSGAHGLVTDLTNSTSGPVYEAVNSFLPTNDPNLTGKPKAYLNWILLDDQFKGVTTYPQSGAIPIGNADILNTLAYSGIPITKNGYLYIWVSNETPGWDVFFDNLSVKHYSGAITEETHYYPFGLTMAGISDKVLNTLPENKYKYNKGSELQSKEFSDGSGLELYATNFRSLDPQLGRWWQSDPKPDMSLSLYAAMGNNPVLFNDPLGDTVNLGNLYEKDKSGRYENIKEIMAFELFSSTKEGKKYLLNHAQKGFSLKGVFVKGLDINAKKEGRLSKKGIDIGLNVVDHIDNGVANTMDRTENGRLKISFSMERSEGGPPDNTNLAWRDDMLGRVDSWAHEFFLHGDLVENQYLYGSKINPYKHDFTSLTASQYGGQYSGWRNSTGLKILQEVQNMPLNMNHGLQPHSDLYLWEKVMMPGLNYLVPINAPKY